MVLGGLGGGWLGEHYGWRSAFTVLGGVGVGYTAVLTVTMKGTPPARTATGEEVPSFWPSVRELLVLPGFRTLLAVNILGSLAYWMVYTWLPLFLYERYQMSLTGAGFSATFYIQAASVAGILAGGVVADRWAGASSRGRLLTQVIGFGVAGPALFLVGYTGSHAVLVAALLVFGVGKGFYDCNQMPVLCQIARPNLRATGYGIFNFGACIAGGIMAFAAGATKNTLGLAFALQLSACVLAVAAVLLLRLRLPSTAT
jgi:predicted MFS family arabinose efflux permease